MEPAPACNAEMRSFCHTLHVCGKQSMMVDARKHRLCKLSTNYNINLVWLFLSSGCVSNSNGIHSMWSWCDVNISAKVRSYMRNYRRSSGVRKKSQKSFSGMEPIQFTCLQMITTRNIIIETLISQSNIFFILEYLERNAITDKYHVNWSRPTNPSYLGAVATWRNSCFVKMFQIWKTQSLVILQRRIERLYCCKKVWIISQL